MKPEITIEDRKIGSNYPPLVIVEVGINHEGNLDKAVQLIDSAIISGAELVKFQTHITHHEMIETNMKPGDISDETLWDIIKRCELTEEEEYKIQKYCNQNKIIYLSTPFSREASDRLDKMDVPSKVSIQMAGINVLSDLSEKIWRKNNATFRTKLIRPKNSIRRFKR